MSGTASLFREIHRLRRFSRDLQEQLDRIPRQRKAYQAKQAAREQALKDEQEAVKKLKVLASDKEKQLKGKGDALDRYTRQQNEVTTRKEHEALMLEMAHARDTIAKLEDEILAAMSESEERGAKLPELEKAVAAVKEEVAKFEADVGKRKADLDKQLVEAQAQLKEAEAKVPRDLKPQYQRTVSSLGADGFAVVRDNACTECNTEIIRSMELNLLNDEFVVCKSCGRILYLPEGAATPAAEDE
jgi:predicted  nucleic acid-binding Zn-ribbon protein